MQKTAKVILSSTLSLFMSQMIEAKSITWCVYDLAGNAGDVMQIMKDYTIAAQNWGIKSNLQVYKNDLKALEAFKNSECQALVASSFLTREYNTFVGTIGAVGLIPNHQVAQQLFLSLGNNAFAHHMTEGNFEVVGWMPVGPAYFMVKDRNLNSITQLAGRKVGVLKEDPSQERMTRRVGAEPIFMSFENAGKLFLDNKIDILASPIYAYQPLELYKGLGHRGGVINFPISYISLSVIARKNAFPKDYGQKSREWFKSRTPKMMNNVIQWEKSMPNKYWYDIPIADRTSYQRLVAQLRKEFIASGVYNRALISTVLRLHCAQNERYFECQK